METHATFFHYLSAPFVFGLVGVIGHFARALWAPWPERMTDKNSTNLLFGDFTGFRLTDIIHDLEFDDEGYYRWDSLRNLKVAVGLTVFPAMFFILASTQCADAYAYGVNEVLRWTWETFLYRIEQNFGGA